MKFFWLCWAAAVIVLCPACRRHEPRQAMVNVPAMRGEPCAAIVQRALHRLPGIERDTIEIDLERRRVVLVYDSMVLALKNIEHAIADAGFQANAIPPDSIARAALPVTCGGSLAAAPSYDMDSPDETEAQSADPDESTD